MNFSIITICFNNLNDLKDTCESVDKQEHQSFEHIIIDGSTNDEIQKWLNLKKSKIPTITRNDKHFYFTKEF